MDKTFQLSGAVVLALALAGCGSSGGSTQVAPITVTTASGKVIEATGVWSTECIQVESSSTEQPLQVMAIAELSFEANTATHTFFEFDLSDENCSGTVRDTDGPYKFSYSANGTTLAAWRTSVPEKGDGSGNWDAEVTAQLFDITVNDTDGAAENSIFVDDLGEEQILYIGFADDESPTGQHMLVGEMQYKRAD